MENYDNQELIDTIDWEDLLSRLLVFAKRRLSPHKISRCDMEPKDFVHQAVLKWMKGERVRREDITLLRFLCGIISSDVNHWITSKESNTTSTKQVERQDEKPDTLRQMEERVTRNQILLSFNGEPKLSEIVRLILDEGYSKPKEIAEQMDLTATEMYNLLKKLRRRLKHLTEGKRLIVLSGPGESHV